MINFDHLLGRPAVTSIARLRLWPRPHHPQKAPALRLRPCTLPTLGHDHEASSAWLLLTNGQPLSCDARARTFLSTLPCAHSAPSSIPTGYLRYPSNLSAFSCGFPSKQMWTLRTSLPICITVSALTLYPKMPDKCPWTIYSNYVLWVVKVLGYCHVV
jgi:hypothetical protein